MYMYALYLQCISNHFNSRMVVLYCTLLQGEVLLLVWNISFLPLVLMWILHSRNFSDHEVHLSVTLTEIMYIQIAH